jgi:hypothetical protein
VVGVGNDEVTLRSVVLTGGFPGVVVDTGTGNDSLDVRESVFAFFVGILGDGDDEVTFNCNTFEFAFLDGGPGHDRLSAHDNSGELIWFDFEEENVTP